MRVPNSVFPNSLVVQLNHLLSRQSALQTQAATGQRIQSGEEDPAAMRGVMQNTARIRALEQYDANTTQLSQESHAVYAAIKGLQQISNRAGEIATLADGTKSRENLKAYSIELTKLIENGVELANRKYQGEYLFGGTRSSEKPFVINAGAEGLIQSVTYSGNALSREVEISEGAALSSLIPGANTSTSGTPGLITDSRSGADFFAHLISLRDHLLSGDIGAIASADSPALRKDEENLLYHVANNGALQARLETTTAAIAGQISTASGEISDLAGADLADTLVRLTQTQTAYQAALQSGAQIMQRSLMDYLR